MPGMGRKRTFGYGSGKGRKLILQDSKKPRQSRYRLTGLQIEAGGLLTLADPACGGWLALGQCICADDQGDADQAHGEDAEGHSSPPSLIGHPGPW
jgi:hypothetical protein